MWCGKVGRRSEDWDPLQEQATRVYVKPVVWVSEDGAALDLVVGVDVDVREELARYSEDDLTRLVQAHTGIEGLLSSRLPMNDHSSRLCFYGEFGPNLVLDMLALQSIVDFDLFSPHGATGKYHYW